MSMKLRKNLGRLATAFVATAMLASVAAVPASADDQTDNIQFVKKLDMTAASGASVPNATYAYKVTGVTPTGTADEDLPIKSGADEKVVVTIDSANFSSNDVDGGTGDADGIKNGIITKNLTVHFDGTYSAPGIYRYQVTETDPTDSSVDLTFTDANDNTFYMDVYVERQTNGTMNVTNTVFMKDNGTMPEYTEGTGDEEPTAVYGQGKIYEDVDTYKTYTLTITKKVEGTMADAGATYKFDVDFSGMPAGTMVTVGNTMYKDAVAANGNLSVDNQISIVPGADGQSVVISGIPSTAIYSVIENLDTDEGYTVSAMVNSTDKVDVSEDTEKDTYTTDDVNLKKNAEDTNVSDEIVITNTRNAVSPTGIVMNVAPYALLVVVAAGACFVFLRKRRED